PGQLVEAAVVSISDDRRALRLTLDPTAVAQAEVKEPFKTMASAQPGQLVSATAVKSWDRGLSLRFMGFYDCSADLTSIGMPTARDRTEIEAKYPAGGSVQVRILYVSLTAAGKVITVSTKPHILALSPRPGLTGYELPAAARLASPAAHDGSDSAAGTDTGMWPIPYGTVLEDCSVVSVAGSAGLLLRIATVDQLFAFAAATQLVDDDQPAPTLHKHAGAFCIGTHHRARVVGYDAIDATVRVTLRPSIVDEALFTIGDVSPGTAVSGTIKSYNEHGAEVAISPTLTGFVHKEDMSDATLKHPELLFGVGKQVKCRVLKVVHDKRRILLTARKSLVQSKLPAITGYTSEEGAVPGALALAVVTRAVGGGVLASFYQGARALVVTEGAQPAIGKAIKCRILTSDPAQRRIKATTNVDQAVSFEDLLAKAAPAGPSSYSSDTSAVSAGQVVGGTAVQVGEASISIKLDGSSLRAVLPFSHLSDHCSAVTARLAARVAAGTRFEALVVTKPSPERSLVMVTAKPAVVKAAAAGRICSSAAEVSTGMTLVGWIQGLTNFGAFVAFPGDLTALAPLGQLSDQYISAPEDSFFVGQTVVAVITSVEDQPEGRRIRVSLKNSAATVAATGCIEPADFLRTYFDELEGVAGAAALAEIGQQAMVQVKQKHSYGVIIAPTAKRGAIPADASGFVTADQAKDAIDKCKPDA
ncbi:rRNA biogenesis protein rrp5, partial [Coemansia spiralis]